MQPIQPLALDAHNVLRFKSNAIVEHLLAKCQDAGIADMTSIACEDFTVEDRMQFAQLIGYSLSGFGTLSYVTDDVYEAAATMHDAKLPELQARVTSLQEKLDRLRESLREPLAELYGKHPSDF
jgi:hypothetical protein